MAALKPCSRRPVTSTPILEPTQSMTVAPPRVKRPTRSGRRRDGDRSASQPHIAGDALEDEITMEDTVGMYGKQQGEQRRRRRAGPIPNVVLVHCLV